MRAYAMRNKGPARAVHTKGIDPLVEARAQVRALETKCARLTDELARVKRASNHSHA